MDNYLDLIDVNRIEDLYKLSRFCYRVGSPILNDADYDEIDSYIKENGILPDFIMRSYDDDPLPLSLIDEFKLNYLLPNFGNVDNGKYSDFLDGEKSLSIKSVDNYKECFSYCMATKDLDKTLSIKINGVNIRGVLSKESSEDKLTPKVFRTRGRNGDSFDVTKNMSRVFNNSSKINKDVLYITGESYVTLDGIGNLVSPSGVNIKVPRSGAMSMLRTDYSDEDYKYLKYKIFKCEGLSDSNFENLQILKDNGYDVVPMIKINAEEIPSNYDEFHTWLKSKMDYFYKICESEGIQADGLVMDIDDVNFNGIINGQYSNRNLALKFEYWSHKYYKAVIEDIVIEQQAVECSVVLRIKPLTLGDLTVARRVNTHSLGILINEGLTVGSMIYFKRHSEVYNVLVYGSELKSLLNGEI